MYFLYYTNPKTGIREYRGSTTSYNGCEQILRQLTVFTGVSVNEWLQRGFSIVYEKDMC